ncbi:MAG: hypothetical protein OEX02_07195 [Cyclobacteriaceae bacterium]|nr:hypothetical protein [Cyclobacteriaceae bacterium]
MKNLYSVRVNNKVPIRFCSLLLLFFGPFTAFSQEEGFEKYNQRTVNPWMYGRHEVIIGTNYTVDIFPEKAIGGSINNGHYIGFDVGHVYRLVAHDHDLPFSAFFATRVAYFPGYFYKINGTLGLDLLAMGNQKRYISALSAIEANITTVPGMGVFQTTYIIHFVRVRAFNWELTYGIQGDMETAGSTYGVDEAMSVFKLSYHFVK